MNILVTGGCGYIGSAVVRHLIGLNHMVVALDNLESGHKAALGIGAYFVFGNINESDLLDSTIKSYAINAIIHLAALASVPDSIQKPQDYWETNVNGTLELLKAAKRNNVKKFIFSSTAAVYGRKYDFSYHQTLNSVNESFDTYPATPYGKTKLAAEHAIQDFATAYGMQYVTFRYFNVAGASDCGNYGEDRKNETHLIPTILKIANGTNKQKLKIYGKVADTAYEQPSIDGTCLREYIHVNDVANAHVLALEKRNATSNLAHVNSTVNLGNNWFGSVLNPNGEATVLQIHKICEEVTGKNIQYEMADYRPGDPKVLTANSELARKTLGWTPQYNIRQIIESAWKWHQKHPNGYSK